jgi:hypothetical protein
VYSCGPSSTDTRLVHFTACLSSNTPTDPNFCDEFTDNSCLLLGFATNAF